MYEYVWNFKVYSVAAKVYHSVHVA